MFRVQDHLRSMELGRRGLVELVKHIKERGRMLTIKSADEETLQRLARLGEHPLPGQINEFKNLLATIVEAEA